MAQEKLTVDKKGFGLTHISRDSAATPFFWILGIVGVFSVYTKMYWFFILFAVVLFSLMGYAFLFDDRKMRSEKYNLDLEKLSRLGEKDSPVIIDGEEEVVQPVLQTKRKQISARAAVKKS